MIKARELFWLDDFCKRSAENKAVVQKQFAAIKGEVP